MDLNKITMGQIAENFDKISALIPAHCTLVAVSKTKPIPLLQEAYDYGQRVFGENKVQELVDKHEALPKDIEWHMIGHLQTNKVKYIAPFVSLIHSVDSLKLLKEIQKQAVKNNRVINCLLQVRIAQEETKFGLTIEDLKDILEREEVQAFTGVNIVGFMGMATNTDDEAQVRKEFSLLKLTFDQFKEAYGNLPNFNLQHISMGMSGDFQMAIEEGSTMVRIGSSLFGARNYGNL